MARSKEMDLTTGNQFRSLLKFAIPVILGNLFQLFYTLADSVIVGKTLGADSLAAVGSTSIIIYFVFCFINGFTGGFGICLGQKCGAKDEKGMRKSVAVSTLLSIAFTVVLTLTCCLLSHQILRWMQIPADISGEAYDYMFVVLLGTGATVFYNMISNMLRALGDSKTPLYFLVFSSVLNIFMDLWMVAGLGLGVFGAALATLIAQGISAVFSFLIFLYRMRRYKCQFEWFDGQELYSMLQIAIPSVLQQSTVSIGMMIVQAVVNPFGTQALAGYSATMRVENVFSLIFVSIGNAVSPYVSQNFGAKKMERIKKGYHAALVLDLCFAVLAFIVIEMLHTQISSLFLGKDGTALAYQVSGDYMRWLGYFFIFMGLKMAADGVLRARKI